MRFKFREDQKRALVSRCATPSPNPNPNPNPSAGEAVRALVHRTVTSIPQAAAACRVSRGLRSAPRGRPHQAYQRR